MALETMFRWILYGTARERRSREHTCTHIVIHHAMTSTDDLLRKFWEIEQAKHRPSDLAMTQEEQEVVTHLKKNNIIIPEGRFVVPLPKKKDAKPLGESRMQPVRRFSYLERSLQKTDKFQKVDEVIKEYVMLGHAELVPRINTLKLYLICNTCCL